MHTGCIGLYGTDCAYARRCRLSGAVAGPASLSLAAFVNRGGCLAGGVHRVDVPVTPGARREVRVCGALHAVSAVHAHGLLGDNIAMTFPAVHRIESASVPAVRAGVAVEAFRRAVRAALEGRQIDFVAIVTGVFFLGVGYLGTEQQARDEDGEELAHGGVPGIRFGKPGYELRHNSNINHCGINVEFG